MSVFRNNSFTGRAWGPGWVFQRGKTTIRVVSHAHYETLDLLIMTNLTGSQKVGEQMFNTLKKKFVGKPMDEFIKFVEAPKRI